MKTLDTKPDAKQPLSRRSFMKRSAALTAGAVGFPYIVPASALGLGGATAPSNRIVMGCIGVGNQGTNNLRSFLPLKDVQFIAVCDVEREHRERASHIIRQAYSAEHCGEYIDFREMLEKEALDAVSIAVPDHWHSIPAIAASNKGLDIYAEKPLALTISEGRAMVDTVNRNGTVWQTGSWQRSRPQFRVACELVRNGRVGHVHTVRVGLPTGEPCGPQPEMPVPDGLEYDFWLGPAPDAPYTEKRCHWNFRWILDYSGGQLTDWGAHHCDIANWGMGTEHTGPDTVEGTGNFPRDGLWNAATEYYLTCTYGPGKSPVSPDGFVMHVSNSIPMGVRFEGTEGWIHVDRQKMTASSDALLESRIGPEETQIYHSPNPHHGRNFIECIRNRKRTVAHIDYAHRAIAIAHLGNISMRLGRKLNWDAERERFIDDPTADRMLRRAMRGEWTL